MKGKKMATLLVAGFIMVWLTACSQAGTASVESRSTAKVNEEVEISRIIEEDEALNSELDKLLESKKQEDKKSAAEEEEKRKADEEVMRALEEEDAELNTQIQELLRQSKSKELTREEREASKAAMLQMLDETLDGMEKQAAASSGGNSEALRQSIENLKKMRATLE